MTLRRVSLREGADLDGFRQAARALVAAGVAPDQVVWTAEGAPVPLPWEENVPLPEKREARRRRRSCFPAPSATASTRPCRTATRSATRCSTP